MKKGQITLRSRYWTTVLYGASGGGKTTTAATAPRPLIADSNLGIMSIADRPGFLHVRSRDVHTLSDLERIYDNCTGTGKFDWRKKFSTIIFDHFDDIQDLVLMELGIKRRARDENTEQDQIEQREYGVMATRLKRYLRQFKQVPMHKILICGEKEDRDTGRMRPSMVGQLAYQLPYFTDHTMYLRIGAKGRRYLHLESTDEFYAKTRAWWLKPEEMKIRVPDPNEDQQFLTRLFARLAAGPKGKTRGEEE